MTFSSTLLRRCRELRLFHFDGKRALVFAHTFFLINFLTPAERPRPASTNINGIEDVTLGPHLSLITMVILRSSHSFFNNWFLDKTSLNGFHLMMVHLSEAYMAPV